MRDLRDWYSYLEQSVRDARPPSDSRNPSMPAPSGGSSAVAPRPPARVPPTAPAAAGPARPRGPRKKAMPVEFQQHLPIDLGPSRSSRRVGRPPLTETRDEIIHRLMDPDLTLHETAAILSLSKATLRRYTDRGKLPCRRTAGGQRRFKLSEVLVLLEQRGEEAR
ncbi:MAG: helix-turn-helix domain-containing protein [Bacillati bacterium ANGP1]|uniref:Helix-turn-helix domain-containing protein n=1 Tax=Candidatus Segetimicrobium genomatis TaxID=2569760 RepID=A0A537IHU1_9BACT|nr:MAG: helix-turn-helix domain-containing protein [Terrabacteria group bacterium ANGP1]